MFEQCNHPSTGCRIPGVLVIDDRPTIGNWLAELLQDHGICAWQTAGGLEAAQVYWHHRHEIDVVVLDAGRPDLNGGRTLEFLRALNPEVRVCFLLGGNGCTAKGPQELGVRHVLSKPFGAVEFVQFIREALPVRGAPEDSCAGRGSAGRRPTARPGL